MFKSPLNIVLFCISLICFGFNTNGQVWNAQIADNTGITNGSYISLAFDKSDHAYILAQDLDLKPSFSGGFNLLFYF